MVAYTWNREKQMFIALGKEFDMFKEFCPQMWAKLLSLTKPNTEQYARFICVSKVDNHLRNLHELKFSIKSLTSSRLICALNLYFAQKLLREAKIARGCLTQLGQV